MNALLGWIVEWMAVGGVVALAAASLVACGAWRLWS